MAFGYNLVILRSERHFKRPQKEFQILFQIPNNRHPIKAK